ncbi:hypothetical protein [Rhodococcus sp. UFZ-B548]|uniref:hypothetical protein n=1 Tax=Rhodococcus sp. UFZ-B548 TaxID=2742212 RepID=UPI0015F7400C|nr:hypothetical protein [Rhodococcus sp. UFZ-B548]
MARSDAVLRPPLAGKNLVETKTLAAPWLSSDKFDLLRLPPHDLTTSELTAADFEAERLRIDARTNKTSLTEPLYGIQVDLKEAKDADLVDVARECHQKLRDLRFAEAPAPVFPAASAHVVQVHDGLYQRTNLPSILLRFEQDPTFVEDVAAGPRKLSYERLLFSSGSALAGPGFFNGTYLGPLLTCRSPEVWAVHTQRAMGTIIFSFGDAIVGVDAIPAEPLQLLPRQAQASPPERHVPASEQAWAEAIDWWVMRLNQMFGYLSDPTWFKDANGKYLPYQHLNWMMNAEELFNRVSSAMMSWRDQYAARILTFSALDFVSEGFLGGDMSALCDPDKAQKALDAVRKAMPRKVQDVLLPRAEAAVEALPAIADGFFITKDVGADTVDVVKADGAIAHLTLNKAITKVVRAHRNATHGFGTTVKNDKNADALASRVLAQHDGSLPAELVYLPYLYLLAVMCDPDKFKKRLRGQHSTINNM